MASLRLCAANRILRNLTKIDVNTNVCFMLRRENHVISGNLISFMKRTSPSLTSMQNANQFQVIYRLQHATVIQTEAVASEKFISTQTVGSTSEVSKDSVAQGVAELKNTESSGSYASKSFDESALPEIPDAPGVSVFLQEPKLETFGLGGWSPSGVVQQILEFFHITFDMPWWGCIVSLTILVRLLLFPFSLKARRDTITFQNNMPQLQKLQKEMSEARKSGNYFEAARTTQEFTKFMLEKNPTPQGMLFATIIQAPVFISVFFALREMAAVPNFTSFQSGGLFWFKDLSVTDQFYLLPLLTSVTVWATIKFGVAAQAVSPTFQNHMQGHITQFLQYGVPVIVFLFTMKFPTAVLCYWTVTNFFVLGQTFLMTLKPVRKYFRIPNQIPPPTLVAGNETKKLGIIEGFKESYTNMKISREIQQRELLNAIKFEEIGNKPARRTFKFDPTKAAKLAQQKKE